MSTVLVTNKLARPVDLADGSVLAPGGQGQADMASEHNRRLEAEGIIGRAPKQGKED